MMLLCFLVVFLFLRYYTTMLLAIPVQIRRRRLIKMQAYPPPIECRHVHTLLLGVLRWDRCTRR
uniref:Uncharacterized protein n=1 Tax=Arundo donax TaxID=35708 RepID=A0A0A8YZ59_ARUDO